MQNIIDLALLVDCPVCPVTDEREHKVRLGRSRRSPAWLGRILSLGYWAEFLWVWAEPSFRPDLS